jgi:CheY-like chemotaxis protein
VAREKGFRGLVTSLGAGALAAIRDYQPAAVTLDIHLPDIDGWRVLDRLKNDLSTRHVPVWVVSTDDCRERALELGACGFTGKPLETRDALEGLLDEIRAHLTRPVKVLLATGRDQAGLERLNEALSGLDAQVLTTCGAGAVLEALRDGPVDCLVVQAGAGLEELIDEARRKPLGRPVPVVLHAEHEPAGPEVAALRFLASPFPVREARSPERLLDQTALVLHCPVDRLPPERRQALEQLYQTDKALAGKKVLIVDDDIRNIFALTSVLEWHNVVIRSAETGRDAIAVLQREPDVDIVLMDIMMPEMDGIDTMRAIRKIPSLKNLPIVAVTAKAMKGDREKCIEAGAWDYLSKPVDTEQMLAVLRSWLHR